MTAGMRLDLCFCVAFLLADVCSGYGINGPSLAPRRAWVKETFVGALSWQMARKLAEAQTQLVKGDETLMSPKSHGTTVSPVQTDLRFNVDRSLADRICSYNRRVTHNPILENSSLIHCL